MRRWLASMGLALGAAACGISADDEVAIGTEESRKIEAQLPMLADAEVNEYVASLGQAIAARTERADLPWRFRVVDTDVVNAFALPGGYIFVNRGLLDRADRMDELAGVLGHEVAHVVLRHSAEQIERAQKTNTGIAIVCSLTSLCGSAAAQVAVNVGGSLVFARFGREAEREADASGFALVVAAGIDPRGMQTFFGKLMEEEERRGGSSPVAAWFGSHPGTADRVAHIQAMLDSLPPARREGLRSEDEGFRRMKQRLAELPPPPPAPPARVPSPER